MGYPIYGNPQITKHPTVDVASRPAARPESVGKLGSAVCSEASNGMRKLDDRRPSAQHTRSYGKSPFIIGKLTISMATFNSYVTNYQRLIMGSQLGYSSEWDHKSFHKKWRMFTIISELQFHEKRWEYHRYIRVSFAKFEVVLPV
jgi:hypothetical protein